MLTLHFQRDGQTLLVLQLAPDGQIVASQGDASWFDTNYAPFSPQLGRPVHRTENVQEWVRALQQAYAPTGLTVAVQGAAPAPTQPAPAPQTQPTFGGPQPTFGAALQPTYGNGLTQPRRYKITRYNQRMARRVARRASLPENAVAVAFTFNNLLTMLIFGAIQDAVKFIPTVGDLLELAISLLSFWFHRIVIVTDSRVYVYRDLPFHIPGKQLAVYDRAPGVVALGAASQNWFMRLLRRGQLTFHDGRVAYHSILWIRRAQYVEQEANIPAGQ